MVIITCYNKRTFPRLMPSAARALAAASAAAANMLTRNARRNDTSIAVRMRPRRRVVEILWRVGLGELRALRPHFTSNNGALGRKTSVQSASEHEDRDPAEERNPQKSRHS